MEEDLFKKVIDQLHSDYGPYIPMIIYLLYRNLREPFKNLINNIKFKDLISFKKYQVEAKKLKSTLVSMEKAILKEREVTAAIDKFRDKYNFKYTHVSTYFNGQYDLLGMGKYKYSIDYEKHRYDALPVRQSYQNQSLIPFFEILSIASKNDKGEFVSVQYNEKLMIIDISVEREDHPLRFLVHTYGVTKVYAVLIMQSVDPYDKNAKSIPIGALGCWGDEFTEKETEKMRADFYLMQKELYQIMNKYI